MDQDYNESEALNKKSSTITADIYKPKHTIPRYLIDRDVLSQEAVIKETGYEARDKSILYALHEWWFELNFLNILKNLLPIVNWLPNYQIKNFLIGDIIAGLTVAVMHIPQGMAYGILAGVTANVGLYMALFPVLIYVLLGTSRHISMGTFAVVSLMTLKVVQNHSNMQSSDKQFQHNDSVVDQINSNYSTASIEMLKDSTEIKYTPLEVVTATAIMVGIIHMVMGSVRLGALASLLSEPLVNGFTTAAAVHVVVTQIKDILGVTVPRHKGLFKIIYTLVDYGKQVENTNLAALIFSSGIILFMTLMNEFIKPWLSKKCRFPLPAELIAVVGGTLISRFMKIDANYSVQLVGNIPLGLPAPSIPPLRLLPVVAIDSIAIAIVSYSVVMSMALIFAKKHSYEVSANQELFALGTANIIGGMFSCIPLACSLSRSMIQEQTGGMTQIASVISALIILLILLFIGPFFNTLPRCVLAGIIVVALKGMFMQAKDLRKFSKQGKLEMLTWISTFISVIIIDIDVGLLIGILVSLAGVYIKGYKPYSSLLGTTPGTGIYVDLKYHKNALEIPKIKIFRYVGSINFSSRATFKKVLYQNLDVDHEKLRRASIISENRRRQISDNNEENNGNNGSTGTSGGNSHADSTFLPKHYRNHFNTLIIDLSALAHIDYAGCKTLTEISKEMEILNVQIYLANPSDTVYDNLIHSMALGEGQFNILSTVHDAVLYAQANSSVA